MSLAETLNQQDRRDIKSYHDWLDWLAMVGTDDLLYSRKMPYPSSIKTDTEEGARLLYEFATDAVVALAQLYRTNPTLFRTITREKNILPCAFSIHPNAFDEAKQMYKFSELGRSGMFAAHVNRRPYFDKMPAPLAYADAIVEVISLEQDCIRGWMRESGLSEVEVYPARVKHLQDWEKDEKTQRRLAKIGKPHLVRGVDYVTIYPSHPPDWTRCILSLQPLGTDAATTLAWWRVGKTIIREEIPDFHLRPEWAAYRDKRHYGHGAKTGAIQNAIFKDILAALKTLAGAHRRSRPAE